jgi:hypothetical protein
VQIIEIGVSALPAHLEHGDVVLPASGICPPFDDDDKVTICHYPPGNPTNVQIITISVNALDAHLAHGDVVLPASGICPPFGEICVPKGGECKDTDDCCEDLICRHGECKKKRPRRECKPQDGHCKVDDDCCHGLRCKDGKCQKKKHHQPGGGTTAPGGGTSSGGTTSVSTLPSTGAGDGPDGPEALGITLAGAAAALFAAKVLRQKPETEESQDA